MVVRSTVVTNPSPALLLSRRVSYPWTVNPRFSNPLATACAKPEKLVPFSTRMVIEGLSTVVAGVPSSPLAEQGAVTP